MHPMQPYCFADVCSHLHLFCAVIDFRIIFYHAMSVQIVLKANSSAPKLFDICLMSKDPSISRLALGYCIDIGTDIAGKIWLWD